MAESTRTPTRTPTRTLLLMRHAQAVDVLPGGRDVDRPLSDRGRGQAAAVSTWLAAGPSVQAVLCSPAVRTRQTAAGLDLVVEPALVPALWNATPDEILAAVAELDPALTCVLVVGHAPGIPGTAAVLADPEVSDPDALATLEARFPTAAVAVLTTTDPWSALHTAGLRTVYLDH